MRREICDHGELIENDCSKCAAEVSESAASSGYEQVYARVEMGVINRLRVALDAADDNAGELLQMHDQQLGRTTKKNLNIAMMYEQEIEEIRCLIGMLPTT